jgi:hypothetical protein
MPLSEWMNGEKANRPAPPQTRSRHSSKLLDAYGT